MSGLVLYRAIASPPARAVMTLGDLLSLRFEYREVKLLQFEHKSEEYKKNINPMGTVPVLQDGDFILSESHAILKYLTERYGGESRERLYPSDVRARALVDQGMFFNSGFFFPRMAAVALPLLLRGVDTSSPQRLQDIEEAYGAADGFLQRSRFLALDHLTLADLAVGATAAATSLILQPDPNKFPRFVEWMNELQEIPSFKNVSAEGIAYLKKFIIKAREMQGSKS
uniref:Glutathione S-transferase epsilon 9 n=1 Tax=Cnaphalocrocis medinalis TaxID=437488 RepID=A0A0A7KL70_CNAME|nr:glutathione S-transferase epsilon 9 [Cnaphalocrocis medinalis]